MHTNNAVADARDAAETRIRKAYESTVMPARRRRDAGIKQVFRIYEQVKRNAYAAVALAEKILGKDSYVLDDETREAMLEHIRAGYERAIEEADRARAAAVQAIVDDYENTLAQADEAREKDQATLQSIWLQYQEAYTSALQALAAL